MNLAVYVASHRPADGEMRLVLASGIKTPEQGSVAVACEIIKLQNAPGLLRIRRWEIEEGPTSRSLPKYSGRHPRVYRLLKITLVDNYNNAGDLIYPILIDPVTWKEKLEENERGLDHEVENI